MADRLTKKPRVGTKAQKPRPATKAVKPRVRTEAEPTVWVEIGPIWLERTAGRGDEVILTEHQRRRIKPGAQRRPPRAKR